MEIIVGSMGMAKDIGQRACIGGAEQQRNALEGMAERKDMKTQHDAERQQVSYDAVSRHGDTFSISEAGKTASCEKDNKPVNLDGDITRWTRQQPQRMQRIHGLFYLPC